LLRRQVDGNTFDDIGTTRRRVDGVSMPNDWGKYTNTAIMICVLDYNCVVRSHVKVREICYGVTY